MEPTKRCSKCREEKLISAFGTDQSVKSGIKAECKQCMNSRSKARVHTPKIVVETKECSQCHITKPAGAFSKWSRSLDGLQAECKKCHSGRNTGDHPRDETIRDKPCTKCGITKLADAFYDNPYAKDGMDSWCKECRKTDNAAWNTNNPAKRKPIANRSAKKARGIPERRVIIYAKTTHWKQAHPAAVQEHHAREWAKRKGQPTTAAAKAYHKQWFLDHPTFRRTAAHNRRALIKHAQVLDKDIDIIRLHKRDKGICSLCHKKVDIKLQWPDLMCATIDHIIPLTKGGSHAWPNVALAHHRCNTMKNNGTAQQQMRLF
jgi:HNH endonuclease